MKKIFFLCAFLFFTLSLLSCTHSRLVAVSSADAPKAIGPYSPAVASNGMIFTSGQIGLSPTTNALAGDDIVLQTQQALKNIQTLLAAGGSDMQRVVKVTVFMKNLDDFSKMNDVYKDYFPGTKPARSTVQVARLPKDALVEIECTALAGKK